MCAAVVTPVSMSSAAWCHRLKWVLMVLINTGCGRRKMVVLAALHPCRSVRCLKWEERCDDESVVVRAMQPRQLQMVWTGA